MIKLVTAPSVEPLSLADAKLFLKVDNTSDDALITEQIKAARQNVETILGYKLITQTWDYYQDCFRDPIVLPLDPVQSISYIKYQDTDNVTQTVDSGDYTLFENVLPAQIKPITTATFPTAGWYPAAVNVRLVVGYADAAADIPNLETILRALKLILADMYENREDVQPSHSTVKLIPNCAKNVLMSLRSFR